MGTEKNGSFPGGCNVQPGGKLLQDLNISFGHVTRSPCKNKCKEGEKLNIDLVMITVGMTMIFKYRMPWKAAF